MKRSILIAKLKGPICINKNLIRQLFKTGAIFICCYNYLKYENDTELHDAEKYQANGDLVLEVFVNNN